MAERKGKAKKAEPKETSPSFEESVQELQQIVGQLEDGSLPLEESMQQFERGISLLRNCYQVLEQAEQRIEILTGVSEDGTAETAEFDASATFEKEVADTRNVEKSTGRKSKSRRGPTSDESLF